jgi:hypothetical protein
MHSRVHVLRAGLVGAVAIVAVACSGGGDDIADPTAETFQTAPPTEPLFTRTTGDTVDAQDAAATAPATGAGTEPTGAPASGDDPETTPPTVPDTGVPGIDSADLFCRSWSEFAGSFQALAGAWALGEPVDAARSEVAASALILAAVETFDANLPSELESERDALAELVAGMSRRAEAADDEMVAAGLTAPAIVALGEAWLTALVDAGVDDPTITVVVPAAVDPTAFESAVTAFAASKPPITEDPSLITDVEIPLTEQYLIANCPDRGTLGGNDEVGT